MIQKVRIDVFDGFPAPLSMLTTFPCAAVLSVEEKTKSGNSSKVSLDSAPTGLANRKDLVDPASPLKLGYSHDTPLSSTDNDRHCLSQAEALSHRPNSMKSALKGSLSRSSSRNASPNRQAPQHDRSLSGSQAGQISLDAAVGAGKSIKQIVGAGLKSPMDFTLGLARGFHNAPKLYGDDSVRQADKVTGLQSGLKAAGKVLSVYLTHQHGLKLAGIWIRVLRWYLWLSHSALGGCQERGCGRSD